MKDMKKGFRKEGLENIDKEWQSSKRKTQRKEHKEKELPREDLQHLKEGLKRRIEDIEKKEYKYDNFISGL